MKGLARYLWDRVEIRAASETTSVLRQGWRAFLRDEERSPDLAHHVAGQIPYFYREPEKIAAEFRSRHNVLDMVIDLAIKAPTQAQFQRSHCGEILAALYLEDILGLRRLMSKLTLTTAQDTNVHKMDGFFVDTTSEPYTYYAVEAKASILPTDKTPFRGHRHGILKQLIESLEAYGALDQRFDFSVIRDNLERPAFTEHERRVIRGDLVPPGPEKLLTLGAATVNQATVITEKDDDYILCAPCLTAFSFHSIVVADLGRLAHDSYSRVMQLRTPS